MADLKDRLIGVLMMGTCIGMVYLVYMMGKVDGLVTAVRHGGICGF